MRLYSHPDCVSHQTPEGHPERSDRLAFLLAHLEQTGFTQDHPVREALPIEDERVHQAHHPGLLERLRQSNPVEGLTPLDPDTWMGPSSMAAAMQAAGSVWQGVNDVVAGDEMRVFCAVTATGPSCRVRFAHGVLPAEQCCDRRDQRAETARASIVWRFWILTFTTATARSICVVNIPRFWCVPVFSTPITLTGFTTWWRPILSTRRCPPARREMTSGERSQAPGGRPWRRTGRISF